MILYVAAAILILSLGFNLLISPILAKNDGLNKEINLTKAKLHKYAGILSRKELISRRYNGLFAGLNDKSLKPGSAAGSLSELEDAAKSANIRIIDIRPEGAAKISALSKGELSELRTEGAIEDYFKFIYSIENSSSLLSIKKIQLKVKPGTKILEGSFSVLHITAAE